MPALQQPAPRGGFSMEMELHNFTWAIVIQKDNAKIGSSRSASFQLPGCLTSELLQVCLL
jgi:hypothetical protein